VQCCGGALAFSEPEKSQDMIKGIIDARFVRPFSVLPQTVFRNRTIAHASNSLDAPQRSDKYYTDNDKYLIEHLRQHN